MSQISRYVEAAERDNTRRSYAAAIRHFEVEWKGLLPTTADATSRYLADHAATLAISTLRQRLAALSRWHIDHGFADPTKAPLVRQVLKGIRSIHSVAEKRARPLEIDVVQQIDQWLGVAIGNAERSDDRLALLRHTRNRSLLLLGFWRGFRSDELVNLRVENVEVSPGEGLSCYLSRSKGDRQMLGRVYKCPALSRLCPVTAFTAWVSLVGLTQGPVFRKIDRWGRIGQEGLHANSLIPLLRSLLAEAGVAASEAYSTTPCVADLPVGLAPAVGTSRNSWSTWAGRMSNRPCVIWMPPAAHFRPGLRRVSQHWPQQIERIGHHRLRCTRRPSKPRNRPRGPVCLSSQHHRQSCASQCCWPGSAHNRAG
ncbi:hypothetical protein [Undibacterium sp. Jales W-56]|uniref:hypothetical protein n=1 Tax=Undibacterium sp. Jales W-56 TaxID=2897325 RepID=UPI003977B6ED